MDSSLQSENITLPFSLKVDVHHIKNASNKSYKSK
jgi:hypothetical protein